MNRLVVVIVGLLVLVGLLVSGRMASAPDREANLPAGRSEVLFWHFWGGTDRDVVEDVVKRFNNSQQEYWVRAIAMPGNNLEAKLFLSIAGGDPPDLVNQDDPIVGDWAERGAILAIDEIASSRQVSQIEEHLFVSARKLGAYEGRLYGVCNGLDIRALYYNKTALNQYGLRSPQSIDDLTNIARVISPPGTQIRHQFAYIPDSRRLWAWGYVFGGKFFDPQKGLVMLESPPIIAAARWMQQFSDWYGSDNINAFRKGDQSLPGKSFPLLPTSDDQLVGRYVILMDGQWRTRDINAFLQRRREKEIDRPEFGVCPLPPPVGGRPDAGWVNGNFFVIPKGAKNTDGALEFMKFWIGMSDATEAATTCAAGGWIPVSQKVVENDEFQAFLRRQPLFAEFVRIASSENQFPIPVVPGAPFFERTVKQAADQILANPDRPVEPILRAANQRIQNRLDQIAD